MVAKKYIRVVIMTLVVIIAGAILVVTNRHQNSGVALRNNVHIMGMSSLPIFHARVIDANTPKPAPTLDDKSIAKTHSVVVSSVEPMGLAMPSGELYADPTRPTVIASQKWMADHGNNAGLQKINDTPAARWFGEWNSDIQTDVNKYVTSAVTAGKIPLLVAYNIPNRDCGGQSAGGAANQDAYASWIHGFAAGISRRSAIVIIEPDSVAAHCFDDVRAGMLSNAITTIASTTNASIFLDSGNSNWLSAATMSSRLQKSNIAHATGFSLNVSNYLTTVSNSTFGTSLSQLIGGKHFVIDTSRNGNGPTADSQWCNAPDRAVGLVPTLKTDQPLIDGFLWVKTPGESDGTCGPTQAGTTPPPAGTWWPEYALMLSKNAGW